MRENKDFFRQQNESIFTPPEGLVAGDSPNPEIYRVMGEENILKMHEAFYKNLSETEISPMFPKDYVDASRKSGLFFIFLLGGPTYYHEKVGNPMMRKRHFPFRINESSRKIWVDTYFALLDERHREFNFPSQYLDSFKEFLDRFSKWMVNSDQ